ncbi:MAG: peptidase S41, partial [Deltaproteobacteria bacterium]|nr:peptidase S41 [Deltaproteobacteria bacterium]
MKIRTFLFLFFVSIHCSFATESKDLVEQPNLADEKTFKKLETFSKVLGYLEQNYIDRLDNEILIEQAIKGMVQNLDPHTVYLTKDE